MTRRSNKSLVGRNGRVLGDWCDDVRAGTRLEELEARRVFSFDPSTVPAVGDLEDITNPVAVIETSLGNIYVELFVDDAPTFVDNFINYLEAGRWSDTLFHRRSAVSTSGLAVLQGGGFYFTDEDEVEEVEDFDPIDDEANPVREHLERTLSFAKAGADTATSQWFINLEDNSDLAFLKDQKFTVFAKVVDDDSWDVVEAIAALPTRNLQSDPNVSTSPQAGNFRDTPIRGTYNATTGFTEDNGVYVVAVTMAKAENADNFFESRLVYPEGFRGTGVSTTVELGNANGFAVVYQVILRYQYGADRDQTLATGTVNADSTLAFRLFEDEATAASNVRPLVPYSIEIWSTPRDGGVPGDSVTTPDATEFVPLAASLVHRDYGGQISESFFDATNAGTTQQEWLLPRIEVDDGNREAYIVFQNLSDKATTATIQIFRGDGTAFTIQRALGALRRGGVKVSNLGLADGVYGVRIAADQSIVAAASQYSVIAGNKPAINDVHPAWGALGTAGDGATRGFSSLVEIPSNGTAFLDIVQSAGAIGSVVTIEAFFDDGSSVTSSVVTVLTAAGGHRQIDLRTAFDESDIPNDTPFTLRVNGSSAVATQTTIFLDDIDEAVAADVPSTAGEVAYFSNGFLPGGGGTGVDEVIAIFNPHRASSGVDFRYQIEVRFSDGAVVSTGLQALGDLSRINISLANSALMADVRTKILTNPTQFSRYTVTVLGFDASGGTPTAAPFAAQLFRSGENTQTVLSNPVYFAGIVPFTSGQFT